MIRTKLVAAIITLVAGVTFLPSLHAQESDSPPTGAVIKSESNLVVVDASVTGKKDAPVFDLDKADFHVYQDGKEQPIASFAAPEKKNAAHPGEREYLLLFFDATTVSLSQQQRVREAAVQFIKKAEQPNLYIAVEDYTGATRLVQNFTTNRDSLAKAVSETKFGAASTNYGEAGTERFLFTLTDLSRSLGQVPGRKAIVLLSGGFAIPDIFRDQLTATIEAANRANVTFYPMGTGGLGGGGVGADVSHGSPTMTGRWSMMGEELLEKLAKETGGFTILNSNDFFRGFTRIAGDLNAHYTLGFVPPESADNGRYHKIDVKVSGHGLKVRARDGYYETKGHDVLAGKPAGDKLLEDAKSSKPGTISMAVSAPFFYLGSKKARVDVALELPSKVLHFEKSKGETRYQFNVLGIAFRSDGSVARRFSDSVSEAVDKERREKLAGSPLHYQSSFEIAPGQYRLVVVASPGGSEFGKATTSLDITPYDEHSLGLSAIVLSNRLQPVSPLLAGLRGQVSSQSGTLIAGGYQIQPSATLTFPASRTAALYVQVYEPALLNPQPPKVGILCEITEAKSHKSVYQSGTLLINSQAVAGSAVVPVAFNLPMNKLSHGKYRLSVIARDSNGGASRVRNENFTIE